jgi:branched-chain amino acid transport system permease protein
VVGAGTIVTLQNYLASGAFASSVPIVIGFIFVVCVMAFRRGIVGEIQAFVKRSF